MEKNILNGQIESVNRKPPFLKVSGVHQFISHETWRALPRRYTNR